MNLIQYRPRVLGGLFPSENRSLASDWDQMLEEFFNWSPVRRDTGACCGWAPRVDIREEKERYVADFELPGLEKHEVQVTLENGVLTVTGERKREETREDDRVYRSERFYGKFARALKLPDDVDAEKIEAGFKNGVLRVAVAKKEESKPRSIEIK